MPYRSFAQLRALDEDVGEAEGVAAHTDGDHVGARIHRDGLGRHCGEGVVGVLGEGRRQLTADRLLHLVGDVLDGGGPATDIGQVEEEFEIAVDELGVGLIGAFAAVARRFEDVACGRDGAGGVGVTQGDPLIVRGGGGLSLGELCGNKAPDSESSGGAEQGRTSAKACHESSADMVLASL